MEQTLFIIKPDAVSRGLTGELINRLEKVGLKMIACKMALADKERLNMMYNPSNEEWVKNLGVKTIETLRQFETNSKNKEIENMDPIKIGKEVISNLYKYMQMGPIICTVWEGFNAVSIVRKIRGTTVPLTASIGTITGDLSHDSQIRPAEMSKSIMNLAHASGTKEEAEEEIKIWFGEKFQKMSYNRSDNIYF